MNTVRIGETCDVTGQTLGYGSPNLDGVEMVREYAPTLVSCIRTSLHQAILCKRGSPELTFGRSALDMCMTAESPLENDEWLENTIEFFVHHLERSLHFVKWEGMGRHERGIDALHLQYA